MADDDKKDQTTNDAPAKPQVVRLDMPPPAQPTVVAVPPPPPIPGPSEKVKTMLESAEIAKAASKGNGNFIKRAWKGEEKLWKVFWLYGVVGGIILNIAIGMALGGGMTGFVAKLPFVIWNLVSCWRCAWNAGGKFWGVIVRILVVLSTIAYIFFALAAAGLTALLGTKGISNLGSAVQCMQSVKAKADAAGLSVDQYAKQHPEEVKACVGSKFNIPNVAAPTEPAAPISPLSPTTPGAPQPIGTVPVAPATSPGVVPAPVAPPVTTPAAPIATAPAPAMDACEKRMVDYATQNGADAKAYVAQNQAYLAECRKVLNGQKK